MIKLQGVEVVKVEEDVQVQTGEVKVEQMETSIGVICGRRIAAKLKGQIYKTVVKPTMKQVEMVWT